MDTVYEEGKWDVTSEMIDIFDDKGYIIVRNLFSSEELAKLDKNVQEGKDYQKFLFMVKDFEGNHSGQVTWNFPGNDVLGMAARSEKVAGTCAKDSVKMPKRPNSMFHKFPDKRQEAAVYLLLEGEVYHYHSKICVKNPKTGGQRAWHQDYGYWYHNGCLFPNMMTVFLAIDRVRKANGCLQVLEGSHKAGRLEHGFAGAEQGANIERVEQIKARTGLTHVEMEPGDALFFHCNLLHTSGTNTSDDRRMAFLPAYNSAANNPVIDSHHPRYNKLHVVPNSAILECENYSNLEGKDFLDIANLKTLKNQVKTD